MRTRFCFIYAAAILLLGVFRAAATPPVDTVTNEYWIGATNTGLSALGTLANPLDGSTAANFDLNMAKLNANAVMHILPGTYLTTGSAGWGPKSGQKIRGSGVDVTILQLVGAPGANVIETGIGASQSYIELEDMTLDCNPAASPTGPYGGVNLTGDHLAVRRVKVIDVTGGGNPGFGIYLNTSETNSIGNIVEECEASKWVGGTVSGILLEGAASPYYYIAATVQKNHIYLPESQPTTAINASWARDVLVHANYVDGARSGIGSDNGSLTNLIVSHNAFENVENGCTLIAASQANNFSFLFNTVELSNDPTGAAAAFYVANATNISIVGNNVEFEMPQSAPTGFAVKAVEDMGVTIIDNHFQYNLTNNTGSSANVLGYDNLDMNGDPQTNIASSLTFPNPATNLAVASLTVSGPASFGSVTITNQAAIGGVLMSYDFQGSVAWATPSDFGSLGPQGYNEQTLTSTLQLTGLSAHTQHLTASGGPQVVKLPTLAPNIQFEIANVGTVNQIIVQDVNGNALASLPPNWFTEVVAQSSTWGLNTMSKNMAFTVSYPGINATNKDQKYILLTVPANVSFVATSVQIETTAKSGKATAGAQVGLGSQGATNSIIPFTRLSAAANVNTFQTLTPALNAAAIPAGSNLVFSVVLPATGPKGFSQTLTADVTGYFR